MVVTGHVAEADVVVLAPERLDGDVLSYLRRSAAGHRKPVVLVIDENTLPDVVTAVEYGLVAIVGRQMASTEDLLHSVSAAATGGGVTSPDMLERLQAQVENVQRRTLSPHGDPAATLTARDVDIMRMLADGLDTAQIAGELSYSVRTVKNLISSLMTRLDLRNRPQVVAYAIRTGAI
ncbi:DNA-binding NarL/FixJ family response regulator [Kibdelosporangium phytohabitans]|nr:response regulator transcription factor [Kibdelosporangium phytohabitans]MBE1461387.1 DNA-binding NarL/FixJ family response regulator [Kibdelosporangium phytohabitans]